MPSNVDNLSQSPDALRNLTEDQTERLTTVLDDYLARLESGDSPNLQEILAQNSDIQEPLKLYIDKLGDLHNFAAGFSPHLAGTDDDEQGSGDSFEQVVAVKPLIGDETDVPHEGSTAPPTTDSATNASRVKDGATYDAAAAPKPVTANDSAQRVPTRVLTGDIDPEESPTVRKLGDFELLRVIGRGGMGIVYEAQQLSLKRRVALKLLPLISVLDARQIARFKNEAQAAANLQHPNIVPVHAVGNYQGVHYYAMRYIDGHALDAVIAALSYQKRLPQLPKNTEVTNAECEAEAQPDISAAEQWTVPPAYQIVVRLGIQAASALAAAHEDGIIHRDIKPSNLMLDKKGKLWITDFGLARRMTDHSLTATGDVLGTLRYMSPEQSKGQTALVDGRSDVYSLGATLYELLALEPAMAGENSPAMLRAIEQQMPISLKQHRPDVPRDLVTVIEKAMAKDRDERYLTAQDFADDLTRVLEGRPTLAKPLTLLELGTKWIQRNQRLVRVSAAIFTTALLFFAAGLAIVLNNSNQRRAAEMEAQQRVDELRSQSRAYLSIVKDLEGIPGTEAVRKRAYGRLLNDFRGFVSSVRQQVKTANELATALFYMSEVQCEMQDWPGALASLTEAEPLFREQVIKEPKRLEARLKLARCMTNLALVQSQLGNTQAAEQFAQQSLDIFDGLPNDDEVSSTLQYDRAKAANSLASLWMRTGKAQAAADMLAKTRERLGQSIARFPQQSDLKEMLFYVDNNLASALADSLPQQAVELYQSAVDIQTEICLIDNRVRPSADLALAYTNLGRAHARLEHIDEARTAYAKANEINELVRQLAPNNSEYLRNSCINLNNFAMAERRSGDNKSAESRFRTAIEILNKLCRESTDNAELEHELGGTYNNLANLLEKSGQFGEVDENYQLAIEHQEKAFHRAPSVSRYRAFLDNHYLNFVRWLTETNRFEQALETVQRRQALWPANDPQQVVIAGQLADAAVALASDKGRQAEAVRYGQAAKRALEVAKDAGLSVQSKLEQDSSSSLAKLKSLTESARP